MTYQIEQTYTHGTPEKTAVLLINLGTPDAPTAQAVRPYLKEFLGDPRVVEIPKLVWWLILNGIILNTRPKKSAQKYASIWMPTGSPLRVYTERQTLLLRQHLQAITDNSTIVVEYAMRYGNPSVASVLSKLKAQNCQRILLVPMYPQFAASSSATALDAVFKELLQFRNMPAIRTVKHFHDDPGYIKSSAQNISDYWAKHGRPDKLVMSFHGVPTYTLEKGDPYHCECLKSGRLIAEALGLTSEQYVISFQSRFGKTEWIKPYTTATLEALGKLGTKRVDVVCPGFVADCLETLEEVAMEGKIDFQQAGGGDYHFIPCLNDRPDWIHALGELIKSNLHGWLGKPDEVLLEQSRLRALAMNAKH
jgi:ferrochelatase